jgi:hypothetical protein
MSRVRFPVRPIFSLPTGPLSYVLLELSSSMHEAAQVLQHIEGCQARSYNLYKQREQIQRAYEVKLLKARAAAVKERLSYSGVLLILRKSLESGEWPANDGAMPSDPEPQSEHSNDRGGPSCQCTAERSDVLRKAHLRPVGARLSLC